MLEITREALTIWSQSRNVARLAMSGEPNIVEQDIRRRIHTGGHVAAMHIGREHERGRVFAIQFPRGWLYTGNFAGSLEFLCRWGHHSG